MPHWDGAGSVLHLLSPSRGPRALPCLHRLNLYLPRRRPPDLTLAPVRCRSMSSQGGQQPKPHLLALLGNGQQVLPQLRSRDSRSLILLIVALFFPAPFRRGAVNVHLVIPFTQEVELLFIIGDVRAVLIGECPGLWVFTCKGMSNLVRC